MCEALVEAAFVVGGLIPALEVVEVTIRTLRASSWPTLWLGPPGRDLGAVFTLVALRPPFGDDYAADVTGWEEDQKETSSERELNISSSLNRYVRSQKLLSKRICPEI